MGFGLFSTVLPNLWVGRFDIFPGDLFVHGISTRHGGVSGGCYDSLNLGLHVEDRAEHVLANRRLFCKALGVTAESTVTCQQVHGADIMRVGAEDIGAGFADYNKAIAATDALITNERGVPLMLFFADCTPILLADPVKKAVGLAHGGWKGTVQSIAARTVEAMQREFGCQPADMLAAIGPSIGRCCYQVGEGVAERFKEAFPDFAAEILAENDSGDIHLDLQLCNIRQLEKAGLKPENIADAHVCTACNSSQFFSYRADNGKTGRIAAVIGVK
ncbi:peptidoglycan editing factor PgeF [Anaerovibrio sp.]|uniref:peptidoglycan editing factor PgeF n=1 Tax=Anaerovibrio sp. TaxID=1872532 RepID=UPI003F155D28